MQLLIQRYDDYNITGLHCCWLFLNFMNCDRNLMVHQVRELMSYSRHYSIFWCFEECMRIVIWYVHYNHLLWINSEVGIDLWFLSYLAFGVWLLKLSSLNYFDRVHFMKMNYSIFFWDLLLFYNPINYKKPIFHYQT